MENTKNNLFNNFVSEYIKNLTYCFSEEKKSQIQHLAECLLEAWRKGNKIFLCGNGGSAGNAIHIANDTAFGLAAGVFTKDIDQATNTVNQLQAGQVYVNSWFTGSVATPFGGYKQSGYSREKGQEAIKGYLQVKNVGIQL